MKTIEDAKLDGKYVTHRIEWDIDEHAINCRVFKATRWNTDGSNPGFCVKGDIQERTNNIDEAECYLSAMVKWDGCSHFNFGDSANPGYLHLCGEHSIKGHIDIVKYIYNESLKKMKEAPDGHIDACFIGGEVHVEEDMKK